MLSKATARPQHCSTEKMGKTGHPITIAWHQPAFFNESWTAMQQSPSPKPLQLGLTNLGLSTSNEYVSLTYRQGTYSLPHSPRLAEGSSTLSMANAHKYAQISSSSPKRCQTARPHTALRVCIRWIAHQWWVSTCPMCCQQVASQQNLYMHMPELCSAVCNTWHQKPKQPP